MKPCAHWASTCKSAHPCLNQQGGVVRFTHGEESHCVCACVCVCVCVCPGEPVWVTSVHCSEEFEED